jgi:hypothetical protein
MDYIYNTEDYTTTKIDYSYSKFHGLSFVKTYINYRSDFFLHSVNGESHIESTCTFSCEEELLDFVPVKKFLSQCLNNSFEIKKKEFDLLIKRFEVTKKVYSFYDSNLRPHSMYKNDLRLENYIAFSYALTEVYEKTKNFKYLNSLLKVNDILCSAYKLLSINEKNIMSSLIKREIDFIQSLLTAFNIELK